MNHTCSGCDPLTSDGCLGDACGCGLSAACAAGLRCAGSKCVCDATSKCTGCCEGETCTPGTTVFSCGVSGASCASCDLDRANLCGPLGCQCGTAAACALGNTCASNTCTALNWVARTANPAGLEAPAIAFDSMRSRTVVFGGGTYSDAVSEWDGTTWSFPAPTKRPAGRSWASSAYDEVRKKVVVFGGYTASTTAPIVNDVWEWDGTSWAKRTVSSAPAARFAAGMAFDRSRGKIILFGGSGNGANFSDTWTLDSSGWVKLSDTGPSARAYVQMAYDPVRQKIVLFGGNVAGVSNAETWELDTNGWKQIAVTGPAGTNSGAMSWDGRTQTVAMITGDTGAGYTSAGWLYNGAWVAMTGTLPSPARIWAAMSFDSTRNRLVLFGGTTGSQDSDQLWER